MRLSAKATAWTEDEDILLLEYQAIYGNKWSLICQHIPGRNGQSCAQRWRHKVNPNILRDKWTPEEDSLLIKLVQELGVGKWASVARHLPGRTDQQCMGRWRRHLDPNIRKDAWTTEEDARLTALYQEHGPSWSLIAKSIGDRTPQQCRGRWCILASSQSKATPRRPPGPGGSCRVAQGRSNPAATAAASGEASLEQKPATLRGCPTATVRADALTELPVMPASTTAMAKEGDNCHPSVPRMTRARVRSGDAQGTETSSFAGAGQKARRLRVLPQSPDAPPTVRKPAISPEGAANQKIAGSPKGRLLLGGRILCFRRRPRSSHRRPRMRLAAIVLPASGGTPSAAPEPKARPQQSASAVADSPPAPKAHCCAALGQRGDAGPSVPRECAAPGDQAACTSLVIPSAAPADGAVAGACEAKGASSHAGTLTCERPTVSTSSRGGLVSLNGQQGQRPAGRTEEAVPGDVLMHMLPRVTRSGRCYPLVAAPAAATTKLNREDRPAQDQSVCDTSECIPLKVVDTVPARDGAGETFSAVLGRQTASPVGLQDRSQWPAAGSLDTWAVGISAAGPDRLVSSVQAPGLEAGPLELESPSHQAMPTTSVPTSLGLSEGLLGAVGATPSGGQPLDWQEVVGSPPTSSFLARMEPGLLQTPTGPPEVGPSPGLLCAPVPPGMPKVTPGFSNEWSDVPALSWSDGQACHGGFGVIGRPPVASAQGTPDNSRPPPKPPVQEDGYVGTTPRRDMYVRPAWQGAGAGPTWTAAHHALGVPLHQGEAAGEGEGQGDTRSLPSSPGGKAAGPRPLDNTTSSCLPTGTPYPAGQCAAAGGVNAAVPDVCSPVRKHHAAYSCAPTKSPAKQAPGVSNRLPAFTVGSSLFAHMMKLKPPVAASGGSTAPSLLAPTSGASSRPSLEGQPLAARPLAIAGQVSLPPALACALLPAQAPNAVGLDVGSSQRRPTTPHQQPPAIIGLPTSTAAAYGVQTSGSMGGAAPLGVGSNGPGGAFPRLNLPKPPMMGSLRSFFPVLSLASHQAGGQNMTRP